MRNTKELISSSIFMFTIASFVECSSLIYGNAGITKNDTWLTVITGFIVSLPIVWVFVSLFEKFPGKNIIEIDDIIFGKIGGKIISILYILFFFLTSLSNCSLMGDFVVGIIMPETPKVAILILFIIVCVYAVRKGIEAMTNYSKLFYFIAFSTLILAIFLLLNQAKFSNLLPMFSLPIKKYIQSTHQTAVLPFADIFVFTMLVPSLKNPQNIKKPIFGGLIISAVFMLGVVLIDILVLGPAEALVAFPAFDVVRLVDIENIMTRMDFIFEIVFILLFFFKISILLYVTVTAIAQTCNIKSYKALVPVVGAIFISFTLPLYDSAGDAVYIRANILPVYQTFFVLILPLITLIIAVIRAFRKNKEVKVP